MENSTDNFGSDVAGPWVKLATRMQMKLLYASLCNSVEDSAAQVDIPNHAQKEVRDVLQSPKNKVAVDQMAALHLLRTKAHVCCSSSVQALNTTATFSDVPFHRDFLIYIMFSGQTRLLLY